jgi:peptide/nickel transport system substrate-binding protein
MRRLAGLLAVVLVAGCRPAPPQGRAELRIAQLTSAITLDPHRHDSSYASTTLGHFYERLVSFGPNLELIPELALRWENPSESVWRFHLRDGVVFHDGRPFGAEDVVASILRARDPQSHVRHYVQPVREAKAIDALTVELVTEGVAPVLLNGLAFVMMVPRDTGSATITHPIGTGPYRFVSGEPGGTIRGERSDTYWGRAPAFGKVAILPMPSDGDRKRAIGAGIADVVAQFPPDGREDAKRDAGILLVIRPGLAVDFVVFSFAPGSPFADRRVRQAVALAVDREELVRNALYGLAAPAWQLVPPTVFGYTPGLPTASPDRAGARALLAQAGHAKGLSSRLVVSQRVERTGRELARQLAEVGITLEVEVHSQDDFYEISLQRDMPIAIDGYSAATGDAANFLEAELHSRRGGLGTFAVSGYSSPRLDALIEKAGTILEPTPRMDVLQAALRLAMEDLPLLPLAARPDLFAFRRGLRWEARHARFTAADVLPEPGGSPRP